MTCMPSLRRWLFARRPTMNVAKYCRFSKHIERCVAGRRCIVSARSLWLTLRPIHIFRTKGLFPRSRTTPNQKILTGTCQTIFTIGELSVNQAQGDCLVRLKGNVFLGCPAHSDGRVCALDALEIWLGYHRAENDPDVPHPLVDRQKHGPEHLAAELYH